MNVYDNVSVKVAEMPAKNHFATILHAVLLVIILAVLGVSIAIVVKVYKKDDSKNIPFSYK